MHNKPHTKESKEKNRLAHLGKQSGMKGKNHTKEAKEKNRIAHLGKRVSIKTEFKKGFIPWNKNKNVRLNPKNEFKMGQIPWNKNKPYLQIKGENHWNYQGGITKINFKIRNSLEYKLWRESVFKRDNFTCIWCGNNKSGNLNADHIKPFALYPELRFAIDNGRTLCVECHKKTDTYFKKIKKL